MKTIRLSTIVLLCIVVSCHSAGKTDAKKASFGIHETVKNCDMPDSIMEKLKLTVLQFENDSLLPVVGYFPKTDTAHFEMESGEYGLKLIRTANTVDKEGMLIGLVAVKPEPVIQNSDIQKTKVTGKDIEIHFNMGGAKKWATMTKCNTGNHVAFVINNKVYDLPLVNAEIKSGVALIRGLENEETAQKLSEALNSSIR
jgi:preprotein translocase subunit SecD